MRPMNGGEPQGMFAYYGQPKQPVSAPPLIMPQAPAPGLQPWQQQQQPAPASWQQIKQNWGYGTGNATGAPAPDTVGDAAHAAAADQVADAPAAAAKGAGGILGA